MVQNTFAVIKRIPGVIFRFAARVLCAMGVLIGSSMTYGDTWPQRPVKVILPFGAGGSSDAQGRIVSERLSAALGQPVIVENRPGASGAIAAELVARAPADGYTVFLSALPQISIVPFVQKVHYDPIKDFAPVSIVSTNPFVLGVPAELPVRTVGEFVEYAKARAGKLYYASLGTATGTHLASVQFLSRAGLQVTHVPYKESSQVFAGMTGGEVQMLFGTPSDMIRLSKAAKVRLLATSGEKRSSQFPDVPALAELYPGFRNVTWNGFLAPAATPRAIIERLAREVTRVVRQPDIAARLSAIGVDPMGSSPAEFEALIRNDAPMWREVVAAAGIRPE